MAALREDGGHVGHNTESSVLSTAFISPDGLLQAKPVQSVEPHIPHERYDVDALLNRHMLDRLATHVEPQQVSSWIVA